MENMRNKCLSNNQVGYNFLPAVWDKESDVVVIGYGAAGATAAITAREAGDEVLILEKAPHSGGNSGVSTGGMKYPFNVSQAANYLEKTGLGTLDHETAHNFAKVWVEIKGWLERQGAKLAIFPDTPTYKNMGAPEKMEVCYLESLHGYGRGCGQDLMMFLEGIVNKMNINVMLSTPVKRLIQNPFNKEIIGVVAESQGEDLYIKARKAVIMALGGFAANREMLATFIEEAPVPIYTSGTPYNTGDGIGMAIDVGADLWHMNGIEFGTWGFKAPGLQTAHWLQPKKWDWMIVNKYGKRFTDESVDYGHSKKHLEVFHFGTSKKSNNAEWPNSPWFMIFDEKVMQAGSIALTERRVGSPPFITYNEAREIHKWSSDNKVEVEKGWIKKADSFGELAESMGISSQGLQETISKYNEYCSIGSDPDFQRSPDSLMPLDNPPYYALECVVTLCNTQGGPRRDAQSRVLAAYDRKPIPRLYAGGEFGSIFGFLYPGACNLSECIVSGLISGGNAAAEKPWDEDIHLIE